MTTVFSQLANANVDSASEEWRHECECRWLLTAKPSRRDKYLWLFGVEDRMALMDYDAMAMAWALSPNHASRWTQKAPLMKFRGFAACDKILADAERLYKLGTKPAPAKVPTFATSTPTTQSDLFLSL